MIISRSPLRITLAGGGTDLPAFYQKYGGSVTSMAIDKYIFVTMKRNILDPGVRLQYLKLECVEKVTQLSNLRARAALLHFDVFDRCEVTSVGDLPASSGLGSSGSYLVAMINNLKELRQIYMNKHDIAELACYIEMDILNEPVGKQDQFIASYGGVTNFQIDTDGEVTPTPMSIKNIDEFIEHNRVYWTGVQRSASEVLKGQTSNMTNFEDRMKAIGELSHRFNEAIVQGRIDDYGLLLNEHWRQKKQLSANMSVSSVGQLYDELIDRKYILGGKIIGAGGGGFLLLCPSVEPKVLDDFMNAQGFPRLEYKLDNNGVKTVYK